jgi:hypothetical protein
LRMVICPDIDLGKPDEIAARMQGDSKIAS